MTGKVAKIVPSPPPLPLKSSSRQLIGSNSADFHPRFLIRNLALLLAIKLPSQIGSHGHTEGGAAYAPYQIPRFTRRAGSAVTLFYVLSTWNPYQVVLMRHLITEWDRCRLLSGFRLGEFVRAVVSRLDAAVRAFPKRKQLKKTTANRTPHPPP